MSFRICCPQCGAFCTVDDDDVGRTALCGNCEQPIIISRKPISAPAAASPGTNPAVMFRQPAFAQPELDPANESTRIGERARGAARVGRWGCLGVIAVIVFLIVAALIMPSISTPRGIAWRSACNNNMKQIGLALHNYHDQYGSFPPPYIADENGRPMHSWRVLLLPFLGEQALYKQYDFNEPWDGPHNRQLWSQIPDVYTCPSAPEPDSYQGDLTPYQVIVGENAVFEPGKQTSFNDIYDGSSNTLLVVEDASSPVPWMQPKDVAYDPDGPLPASLFSSNHEGWGTHVLYADGRSEFLDEGTTAAELRSLIERSDGVYHVR